MCWSMKAARILLLACGHRTINEQDLLLLLHLGLDEEKKGNRKRETAELQIQQRNLPAHFDSMPIVILGVFLLF